MGHQFRPGVAVLVPGGKASGAGSRCIVAGVVWSTPRAFRAMTVKPSPPSVPGKPIATRSDGSADMTSDPTTETTNWFFRALEHHPMIMSGLIAAALGIMTGLGVFFLMFL